MGVILYVEKSAAPRVFFSARLMEDGHLARAIDLPVVREEEFRQGIVSLLNVPRMSGSRVTLRVYDPYNQSGRSVNVTVRDTSSREVLFETLLPLEVQEKRVFNSRFDDFPSFGTVILDLGSAESTAYVEVTASGDAFPLWAFISVTDNATQETILVTPQ